MSAILVMSECIIILYYCFITKYRQRLCSFVFQKTVAVFYLTQLFDANISKLREQSELGNRLWILSLKLAAISPIKCYIISNISPLLINTLFRGSQDWLLSLRHNFHGTPALGIITGNGMMTSSHGRIFALLAFCAGNSPVTGEFSVQRPVTRSFDIFFDLRVSKRLNKQSKRRWFETPSRSLWRHCNWLCLYDLVSSGIFLGLGFRQPFCSHLHFLSLHIDRYSGQCTP